MMNTLRMKHNTDESRALTKKGNKAVAIDLTPDFFNGIASSKKNTKITFAFFWPLRFCVCHH